MTHSARGYGDEIAAITLALPAVGLLYAGYGALNRFAQLATDIWSIIAATDWLAVLSVGGAIAVPVGGCIAWIIARRDRKRDAKPIVTLRGRRLEIINRIAETLTVERIDAPCDLAYRNWGQDEYGEETRPAFEGSPIFPGWEVAPDATAYFDLSVERIDARISVTITSSFRSIRCKLCVTPQAQ